MSGDYFRPATYPVARVQHVCIGCGTFIPVGEKYHRQTGFYDGAAFVNKLHFGCAQQLEDSSDGGNYEFTPGECEPPEATTPADPLQALYDNAQELGLHDEKGDGRG